MYILYTNRRKIGEYILELQRMECLYCARRTLNLALGSSGFYLRPRTRSYMYFFSVSSIRCFGTAPTIWSTGFPFLNTSKVGIAIMSNLPEVPGFSSVFSFPKATFPWYSLASASMTGPTTRQGPHQGAQQSTRIKGYLETKESKLESSTFTGESGESVIMNSTSALPAPIYA